MAADGEMQAVQVVEFKHDYRIQKTAAPEASSLKPYDLLLKTACASLCHTDSMVLQGKFPTPLPCTASHEGTGTVVAVGKRVDAKDFKVGDRVMSGLPRDPCGQCISCRGQDDWRQYCEHIEGHIGVTSPGGAFADYHVVDARTSNKLPDNVSFVTAAPLACAGRTIYRALIVSEVKRGGWLAIVGAGGGLGHLGIQFARARGIEVVAIDARDEALDLCKKAGAKHIFDARRPQEDVVKAIQGLTDGLGVEASINLSEADSAAALACAVTRMHGLMVQVAQPDQVSVPFAELIFRDIRIIGSLLAGQEQSQAMLRDVAEHGIKVETNLFHGLDQVPRMVELSHSGKMKGKAVCVVDEEQLQGERAGH